MSFANHSLICPWRRNPKDTWLIKMVYGSGWSQIFIFGKMCIMQICILRNMTFPFHFLPFFPPSIWVLVNRSSRVLCQRQINLHPTHPHSHTHSVCPNEPLKLIRPALCICGFGDFVALKTNVPFKMCCLFFPIPRRTTNWKHHSSHETRISDISKFPIYARTTCAVRLESSISLHCVLFIENLFSHFKLVTKTFYFILCLVWSPQYSPTH